MSTKPQSTKDLLSEDEIQKIQDDYPVDTDYFYIPIFYHKKSLLEQDAKDVQYPKFTSDEIEGLDEFLWYSLRYNEQDPPDSIIEYASKVPAGTTLFDAIRNDLTKDFNYPESEHINHAMGNYYLVSENKDFIKPYDTAITKDGRILTRLLVLVDVSMFDTKDIHPVGTNPFWKYEGDSVFNYVSLYWMGLLGISTSDIYRSTTQTNKTALKIASYFPDNPPFTFTKTHNFRTNDPDLSHILELLLQDIQSTLGEKLLGLYVYGSLAGDDFDYGVSDIDLLAVLSTDITEKEKQALEKMHEAFVKNNEWWKDRIEIQYVSKKALKTYKTEKNIMAVISPREPLHIVDYVKEYLMNFYLVREQGLTIFGPEAKNFIDQISKEEFLQEVVKHAKHWRTHVEKAKQSRPYQAYAILTLCRALYTYKHGQQVSKIKAATWAEKEFPEWASLIKNALKWRLLFKDTVENPEETYPETRKFVHFMIDQIIK